MELVSCNIATLVFVYGYSPFFFYWFFSPRDICLLFHLSWGGRTVGQNARHRLHQPALQASWLIDGSPQTSIYIANLAMGPVLRKPDEFFILSCSTSWELGFESVEGIFTGSPPSSRYICQGASGGQIDWSSKTQRDTKSQATLSVWPCWLSGEFVTTCYSPQRTSVVQVFVALLFLEKSYSGSAYLMS